MKTVTKSIVGLKELRENMNLYISGVEKGRSFTVVRRSQPIFRLTPVDVWGDEGAWETVVDFIKIKKGGVPIEKVIGSLNRLNAQDR